MRKTALITVLFVAVAAFSLAAPTQSQAAIYLNEDYLGLFYSTTYTPATIEVGIDALYARVWMRYALQGVIGLAFPDPVLFPTYPIRGAKIGRFFAVYKIYDPITDCETWAVRPFNFRASGKTFQVKMTKVQICFNYPDPVDPTIIYDLFMKGNYTIVDTTVSPAATIDTGTVALPIYEELAAKLKATKKQRRK